MGIIVRSLSPIVAGCIILCSAAPPLSAQSSCSRCPGASSLDAWTCPVDETVEISSGCLGFNNCQKPETAPQGLEAVETSAGVFQVRLSVGVVARWNSQADTGANGKLDMWWRSGGTATHPTGNLCEHNTSDRVTTQLRFGGLTCDGAPYELGTYSLRAVVCGGSSCQKVSEERPRGLGLEANARLSRSSEGGLQR